MILDNHTVEIYDNNNETIDRYTIVIDGDINNCYAMSDNPGSPIGFNQYVGKVVQEFLDNQTKLDFIPAQLVKAIQDRFE